MEKKSYQKPMANANKLRVQSILAGSTQQNAAPRQSTEEYKVEDTKTLNWFS